ncbi:hypothetical protein Bca52824_058897 [Brassica carinata]|uniref:Uncharacterized protein n=1 Tax=Brassica carinata TaxID=52824 RepID=A0A8X7QUV4_BRACI|nr:hypothetical protein Bca52824_058897 [Brassica carinata]
MPKNNTNIPKFGNFLFSFFLSVLFCLPNMKDRGKRTATERRNDYASFYYSTPSDLSCRKHPSVSAVGICPYCLNDRLVNLVCSECGEQRLSSCSCSEVSPNPTSNVVRISSFIDEEATKQRKTTEKSRKTEEVVVFKRSSSSCVEISKRKHHRFSKIGRFFRKINLINERALDYNDDGKKQSVSRSRSLCSFRGGNGCFIGSEEDVVLFRCKELFLRREKLERQWRVRVFDTTTEHRKSNFEGRKATSARRRRQGGRSNYEAAARKSDSSAMSFTRRVLSVKDGEEEEPGFIEIKFDSSRRVVNDGVLEHGGGGSCRLTTKDREGNVMTVPIHKLHNITQLKYQPMGVYDHQPCATRLSCCEFNSLCPQYENK